MKSYYNIDTGETEYLIGDSDSNIRMTTDGDLVMKMGDNLVMDLDSGKTHHVFPLGNAFEDEDN